MTQYLCMLNQDILSLVIPNFIFYKLYLIFI